MRATPHPARWLAWRAKLKLLIPLLGHRGIKGLLWQLCRHHVEAAAAFFLPTGPSTLTWFHQVPAGSPPASPAQLFLGNPQVRHDTRTITMHAPAGVAIHACMHTMQVCTTCNNTALLMGAQKETPANKVVYFVRTNAKGVGEKSVDGDVCMGTVPRDSLEGTRALYLPILAEQGAWGRSTPKQAQAFLQVQTARPAGLESSCRSRACTSMDRRITRGA